MAFFDKLNDLAKNVSDKANDAIETTKLNNKINAEKAAIAEDFKKIGEYYYAKHATGETTTPHTPTVSLDNLVCPACGKQNNPGTNFCCECGAIIK